MSKFHARGLVYLGARSYYEAQVPGGALAVTKLLEPELADFFSQLFLSSSMYDALPILRISATAAQLVGVPQTEFVRRNAAWLAERDLRGVFKFVLNALPAEMVATRLPRLALKYFDFGEASAHMEAERTCIAQQRGIPAEMAPWFRACVQGFVPVALSTAGAKTVRVRSIDDEQQASLEQETLTLRFEFRWA